MKNFILGSVTNNKLPIKKTRPSFLSVTHRRRLLDKDLITACASLQGTVIDLGGEWKSRRGAFRPPQRPDLRWLCFNLDPKVAPDCIGDVGWTPLKDACADAVVCTEVLEHVPSPKQVLAEAYRLLQPGGQFIASMPFMFRVHGDPYDYQRYTSTKLTNLLTEIGFHRIAIYPQGLYFTVLADLIRSGLAQLHPKPVRWMLALCIMPFLEWLVYREERGIPSSFVASYVTGYFITAYKPNLS